MNFTDEEIDDLYPPNTPYISPSLATTYLGTSLNNGGSTSYYKLDPNWKDLQDIIEARNMNYAQGNIFKAAFTFNLGRHDSTTYERELNKITWFVERELKRLATIANKSMIT